MDMHIKNHPHRSSMRWPDLTQRVLQPQAKAANNEVRNDAGDVGSMWQVANPGRAIHCWEASEMSITLHIDDVGALSQKTLIAYAK